MGYSICSILDISEVNLSQYVSGITPIPKWLYPSLVAVSGGWITQAELEKQIPPLRRPKIVGNGKGKTALLEPSATDLGLPPPRAAKEEAKAAKPAVKEDGRKAGGPGRPPKQKAAPIPPPVAVEDEDDFIL